MGITTAAMVATIYGTVSCRLVVLTLASTIGNSFEEHFAPDQYQQQQQQQPTDTNNKNDIPVVLNNGVGLFQWLRPVVIIPSTTAANTTATTIIPNQHSYDWTKGSCTGYQQTMLNALTNDEENPFLTIGRILAITTLLLSCGLLVLWVWSTACLALTNRFQGGLFLSLALLGTIGTAGSVVCMMASSLCGSDSDIFAQPPHCQIDQGGLVMLGASLLWLCTAIIAACYILPGIAKLNTMKQQSHFLPEARLFPGLVWQQTRQRDATTPREIHVLTDIPKTKNDWPKFTTVTNVLKRFRQRRKNLHDVESNATNPRVTVDATEDNTTEVYLSDFISDRLDRIEHLVDTDDDA